MGSPHLKYRNSFPSMSSMSYSLRKKKPTLRENLNDTLHSLQLSFQLWQLVGCTLSVWLYLHILLTSVYIYICIHIINHISSYISSCIIIYHHISLHIHQIWTDIFRKCCLNSSSRQFLWTKHHTSSSENDADRLGARSLQVSVMPKSTGWLSEIQEMNNSLRWGMTDGPRF